MTPNLVQPQTKSTREAISWTDGEVESIVHDRFNFDVYADVLSERIRKTGTPSTVGIVGSWGSGKSSLMKIIREALEGGPQKPPEDISTLSLLKRTSHRIRRRRKQFTELKRKWATGIKEQRARCEMWLLGSEGKDFKFQKEDNVKTIWINVWELSTQEEVWHAFLQAIFGEVYKQIRWWRKIAWRKLADQAARNSWRILVVVAPVLAAVYLGKKEEYRDWGFFKLITLQAPDNLGFAIGIGTQLAALFTVYKPTWDAIRKSVKFDLNSVLRVGSYEARVSELMKLRTSFAEVVNLAVGDEGRIVIFIDDLDRCTPDKVPDVLEAIKLFAMTKGCVYVLAFDQEVVAGRVAKKYRFTMDEGIKYLEKIVQIPFQLPPLDDTDIKQFIKEEYEEIEWDIPEVLAQGLGSNPRTIKRAVNTYRILRRMEQKRVAAWVIDPLDSKLVAKLVIIQTRFRRLYEHLVEDPEYLLRLEAWVNGPQLELKPELKSLINSDDEDALRTLLRRQQGDSYFQSEQERNHVHWYICLGGDVAVANDRERPDRKYRARLLSNDPNEIAAAVDEILPAGQYLPEWESNIRNTYLRRLREILGDDARYTYEQRLSASLAMDKFERRKPDADWAPKTVRAAGFSRLCGLDAKDVEKAKEAGIDLKLTESDQKIYDIEPPDFRIGQFPVTNEQFARFVTWVLREDSECESLRPGIVEYEAYWPPCRADWDPEIIRKYGRSTPPAGYQVCFSPEETGSMLRAFQGFDEWTNPIIFRDSNNIAIAEIKVRLVLGKTASDTEETQSKRTLEFELIQHPGGPVTERYSFRIELIAGFPIIVEPTPNILNVVRSGSSKSGVETKDLLIRLRLVGGGRKEFTEPPSERNAVEVDIMIWDKRSVMPLNLNYVVPATWHQTQQFTLGGGFKVVEVESPENKAQHPVTNVSWETAVLYCIWLKKQTGVPYRLPTEIEWQLAAGARLFPWGDDWADDKANTRESSETRQMKTTPVDAHPAGRSPFCAEDMAGNVWEWCADTFSELLDWERTGQTWQDIKMHGPLDQEQKKERCVRGGSYDEYKEKALASHRESRDANYAKPMIGFRVAVSSGWEVLDGNRPDQKDRDRDTDGVADTAVPQTDSNVVNLSPGPN